MSGRPDSTTLTRQLSVQFHNSLLRQNEGMVVALARRAVEKGVSPEAFLLEVVAPAQLLIGDAWASGAIGVAQEHAATALSDRAVALVLGAPQRAPVCPPVRGRITVACVEGEWHALSARLVADVLRLHGWQVTFLGAHVPTHHLRNHLRTDPPQVLALSCSMASRLPYVHAAVDTGRSAGIPVLAGGPAFGPHGARARDVGADHWCKDAPDAVEFLAAGTISSGGTPPYVPDPADWEEFSLLTSSRARLVHDLAAGLGHPDPAHPLHHTHLTDHLTLLAESLASSVYLADEIVFAEAVSWLAAIGRPRQLSAAFIESALERMAARLRDFPHAAAVLHAAVD
ncbi:cobalamin B12-binding domain-containing protein [Streptomyces beijiangensis]|uniref:Cobalamin-dependent protein n=1 Tax=Streptomyces beijiangensis TaxID=163361 RepID=A0A939JE81_9ACTN|nr:cobalamin-dependent protein [Streptomyces beijiangensis]MBO0512806.1 cobalamin-dependent protein [Streptomyces beijiangensis]